ncbi:hypothetical protein D9M72_646690 [compost metagenome]
MVTLLVAASSTGVTPVQLTLLSTKPGAGVSVMVTLAVAPGLLMSSGWFSLRVALAS